MARRVTTTQFTQQDGIQLAADWLDPAAIPATSTDPAYTVAVAGPGLATISLVGEMPGGGGSYRKDVTCRTDYLIPQSVAEGSTLRDTRRPDPSAQM